MTTYHRFAGKFGEIEVNGPDRDNEIEVTISKPCDEDKTVWIDRNTAILLADTLLVMAAEMA